MSGSRIKPNDMIGKMFGYWLVLSFAGMNKRNRSMWLCQCILCNKRGIIRGNELRRGASTKCKSCRNTETDKKHGLSCHPAYGIYTWMLQRCYNKNNTAYKNYGGRGIRVCDEWKGHPEVFIAWALKNGWSRWLSLDRIDNNGNYEPSNCRFTDPVTQANNKRNRT